MESAVDYIDRLSRLQAGEEQEPEPIRATLYAFPDPASIPRREWLYGRHLIRRFVSVTVAPGSVGKTSLIVAESLALAAGKPLLGQFVGEPCRVWLWNLEDPRDELDRRIAAAMQHYGLTPEDIGDRLYLDIGREQEMCTAITGREGAKIIRPAIDSITAEMQAHKIDVLRVDPFISSHHIPENDNPAIDMVAKEWGRVSDRTRSAIELVHHTRKQGDQEINAESSRGAKALIDAARSVRVLNRMTKDEAERAGVEDDHRRYFRMGTDKANLAPPEKDNSWFHLASVELPNRNAIGIGDDIGVVEAWQWPDAFDGITAHDLFRVQQAIEGKNLRLDAQARQWVGHAVAEALGLDSSDKADKNRIKLLVKTWLETEALVKGTAKDEKSRDRAVVEVGRWAQ